MDRKIDVTDVFERVFRTYAAQAGLFIPAALLVFLPVALATVLLAGSLAGFLVVLVLGALAGVWRQGMAVEAVRDISDGRRDHTVGSLVRSVTPVLGALFLAGLLYGLGVGVGILLLIVPGLFLLTIWAVVAPVVVIERTGVLEAFGRSRELVRGNGWPVFGVIVVFFLVQAAFNQLLTILLDGRDSAVGAALASLVSSVAVAPLAAIAATIVYLELRRVRGEGEVDGAVAGPATAAPLG